MITELRIAGYPVSTKYLKIQGKDDLKVTPGTSGPKISYILTKQDSDSQSEAPVTPIITGSYLRTINGVSPMQQGQFMLMGDYCTSVVQGSDDSDPQISKVSGAIKIFDGCQACVDCSSQWYVQSMLQQCMLWLAGLKDCILYYEPAAARLWNQMLQKRVLQIQNCGKSEIDAEYRQREFGKAVKLLYQYKAVVAMWNYLVFTKARSIEVVKAPETHLGFIMQSKRIIDFCDAGLSTVTLHLKATLQAGQTQSFLAAQGRAMLLSVTKVTQNTYIQYGKDTGSLGGGLDTGSLSCDISATRQPVITCSIQFFPTKQCRAVFSGSIKVLPVIVQGGSGSDAQVSSSPLVDLGTYAEAAYDATDIDKGQLTKTNRWRIQLAWQFTQGDMVVSKQDTQQVTYFTSGFGLYPSRSDSESGPVSGGNDDTGGDGGLVQI